MIHITDEKIKRLTLTGLLTALVAVSTMAIRIPVPATGGYIHPGDGVVLLSGFLLGPIYGAFAAGIGSALSDLLAGYFVYVPATFIIKGATAFLAGLLYRLAVHKGWARHRQILLAVMGTFAEIWMVFGYFLFESFLYNPGAAAVAALPNAFQGIVGVGIALALYPLLHPIVSPVKK